jgi:succinate dehydrogenase / fumarate reductase, cytochrome b subunit
MNLIQHLFASSLGKKYLMAVSGLALLLFTVGHMIGNLQIFLGRETINTYAAFLQTNREILWTVRLGLLAMVIIHIWAAASLTRDNRAARPLGYEGNPAPTAASYASRTMVVSGIIIAAFIIYHLLHYTAQFTPINLTGSDFHTLREPLRDGTDRHDVFAMMILGFRQPLVSLF